MASDIVFCLFIVSCSSSLYSNFVSDY